ncbi:MAG: sulfite exporter TauE/SafE family protein [Pseudomonadota bacterium]
MTVETVLLAMAAFAAAGSVKGVTGLGFSTTALPILTFGLGLKEALPLVILPSLASNVAVMAGAGGFGETLRRFRWMYLASLLGIAAGLALLGRAEGGGPAALLGAALIAFCAFAWAAPDWRLPERLHAPLAAPTGFLTGLVNGLTGSQVLPVTPYLLSLGMERERMVQAVNLSFTICSLAMMAGLSRLGLVSGADLALSAAGIPVAFGAVEMGARLRRRLPERVFRNAVLAVLSAAGAALILRSL